MPLYNPNGTPIAYTVEELPVEGYETSIDGTTIINRFLVGNTEIKGKKVWVNGPQEKPEITIILKADGTEVARQVLPSGTTEFTFTNLPVYNPNGTPIAYTVEELPVEGYETSIDGTTIINRFLVGKTEIKGKKVWVNGPQEKPEITVVLKADGVEVDRKTLASGTTEFTFTNLPVYNPNGTPIAYTVEELPVEGYETKIEGTIITNTFLAGTTSVEGTKVWVGGPSVKPEITILLMADGAEVQRKAVPSGTLKFTFEDLPKYHLDGTLIVYTLQELEVPHYKTTIKNFEITNTFLVGTTKIVGEKTWVGGPAEKPEITILLRADGREVKRMTLVNGITAFTFENLPMYHLDGTEIQYTVDELPIPGYATTVDDTHITNTFLIGETQIKGTKMWVGGPIEKPEITILLLADGKEVQRTTLPNGTTTFTFDKLPIYHMDGTMIVYSLKELPVEGYDAKIEKTTVINTYKEPVIETMDIKVDKVWVKSEGKKPDITINLLANGIKVASMTLKDGTTSYTFRNFPIYDATGTIIRYAVTEDPVKGYKTAIKGLTIVNTKEDLPWTGTVPSSLPLLGMLMIVGGFVLTRKKK
ncbi:hypothetical protein ABB02_00245 [Clostridiaceae bacterium JG1575]|nr:hypothetical protein ABB02_00245 [Clostridiaceae bacterium JG1575]